MIDKSTKKMGYPVAITQPIREAHSKKLGYPLETRMDKGFQAEPLKNGSESVGYPPSPKTPEFIMAKKAMELTGSSWTTTKRHCQSGKFKDAKKTLTDGTESWKIPVTSLPPEAQSKYWGEVKAAIVALAVETAPKPAADESRSLALTGGSTSIVEAYERSTRADKDRAEKAVAVVRAFKDLVKQGFRKGAAIKTTMTAFGVSYSSVYRYLDAVNGHPVSEWHARLSPKWGDGRPPGEFTADANQFILGLWLSDSEPTLSSILVTARDLAPSKGWVIPSYDTVLKSIDKLPRSMVTAGRKGFKALEQGEPSARRDYNLPVNDTWCSDGHRLDFFVQGPDGVPYRLFLIAWCDVRSRAVLGVVVCRNPDAQSVLRAFGMAMQRTGTAPRRALLDNGMEYASKLVTGGQDNRYRFKALMGEKIGILTKVGTIVDWALPARGQAKPIESFWNFIIKHGSKAIEFKGCYCGKNTAEKPAGFDPKKHAVTTAVAEAKLEFVLNFFNTRHKHRGRGMNRRTAQEVYTNPAYQEPFRPVDPMHIEMCNRGAAQIKPDRQTVYTLVIPGHGSFRYWSEKIHGLSARELDHKHQIYYAMDDPKKPIWVMDRAGALMDRAQYIEDIPFREADGGTLAIDHKRAKNARMKPVKDEVKRLQDNAVKTVLGAAPKTIGDMFSRLPVTIDVRRAPPMLTAPEEAVSWEETDEPGKFRDKASGTFFYAKRTPAAPMTQGPQTTDDEEQRERELDEKVRIVQERKRLLRA